LSYVALKDDRMVGSIMYTASKLIDDEGGFVDTITFGPVSVLPEFQRLGIGSMLIWKTIDEARVRRDKAVIIYGHPKNYCKFGLRVPGTTILLRWMGGSPIPFSPWSWKRAFWEAPLGDIRKAKCTMWMPISGGVR
jgi:predicted N-acetyltransferase YhbS